jgi:hypothetical protein
MKRWMVVLALLLFLGYTVGVVAAPDFAMTWWRISAGGTSGASGYTLSGAMGQAEVGTLSGGGYTLTAGFWGAPYGPYTIFLPLALRH